ncbi:glutathione transferase GstA [Comamonas testosteroni]|jgi:glutathione S-transferase|uniref:Glutathione S-transferase domain protein n=2 Tax=Comamonas testosteroni TaxID=285 RepID=B7X1A8_COMTK|nr:MULTISPECIES: glutathione transferase GstA [Comamonas]AIJ44232.1 Gst [Comamonas testosteroni TK102]EED70118.1 Glutathione S-transferase domain protein [Comamonas testosteroni KF-1]MPS89982.1 glutathione transferase GstA [Comamonas sp.]WQG68051.1 glutathione transferase GstA [Comamonas testosteroni]
MKLYYSPGACSLSPHIVLHEAELQHETVMVSTKSHKLQDGTDYYGINPLGYVPFLVLDSGDTLREGPAIVQYLADLAPEKNLAPANGTVARYHLQEWLNFISTEVHKGFGPLFNPATPEDYKPLARASVLKRLAWVNEQLANKSYLMGDQFTVADAYFFTITGWAQFVGLDISELENIQAYRERILARPAVQAAMKAEGLLK